MKDLNQHKNYFLSCKDYTVSNQKFDLLYNKQFSMLETFPKPKEDELAFYYESENYISHTDTRKSIIEKLYQIVKNYTLNSKLKLINSFNTKQKNILDVGCGTGDFLLNCKNNGWDVIGVEPNTKAKSLAENKLNIQTTSKIYEDLSEIKTKKFDVITLWHVLEHVPNLDVYISNLKKILKQHGVLIIAVPNYKSYDATYYKQFWAAYDVPRHLWHFSKKSIQLLFAKEKMEVHKILPMKFDSFYVSLLSEKYKSGKNNFLKAFFIGWLSNIKAFRNKEYSSLIYVLKNS